MLICAFVVLIWTLPIYALDLGNTTSNLSINSTGAQNQVDSYSVGSQIAMLKNMSTGKFKDIQDLHLKILHILDGMRLLGQQNNTHSVRYYAELETRSAELERLKRSMIGC